MLFLAKPRLERPVPFLQKYFCPRTDFSSGSSLLAFPTTEVYATPLCATVLWCIYVMEEMVDKEVDKEMDKKVDKEVDEEVDEEGKEKVYATPPQPPLCHRQWWDAFKTV